jgi:tetratricopeptide (TPR) repeat protein
MVFSIMEKPVSDAQKIGSASERRVLIPQTEAAYRKAYALDSDSPTAGNLALTLAALGRAQEANEFYRKAIAMDPNYQLPQQLQHGEINITIPSGIIGIRGTDVKISYTPSKPGYIKLREGHIEVKPRSGAAFEMDAGHMAVINEDGSISQPMPMHKF